MGYQKNNLKQEYLKQSVMTATPAELIVMLFDACIKNLKLAEICLEEHGSLDSANLYFQKAQKIIMELVNGLDTSQELSSQLLEIYDFLLHAMREMNSKKDISLLPDVLDILASLRDTWQKIARPRYVCSSEVG